MGLQLSASSYGLKGQYKNMNWFARWETYALASAFFAGLTAFWGKLGVSQINSNMATFIRTAVILFFIGIVLSWRQEWQLPQKVGVMTWIFLGLSALATGASWLCYYRALQLGTVSTVASVDKLSIVIAIILGVLFLGEPLSWKIIIGGALVTIGAIVLVLG